MGEPRSVRFETATIEKLSRYAARHPGMTSSGAAAQLVEEGLRMDAFPGVLFREGPAGRRAGLMSGPDVWEVVRAVRKARTAEPRLDGEAVVDLVAENANLPVTAVRLAIAYYSAHPGEVDQMIESADQAEEKTERELQVARALLDS